MYLLLLWMGCIVVSACTAVFPVICARGCTRVLRFKLLHFQVLLALSTVLTGMDR